MTLRWGDYVFASGSGLEAAEFLRAAVADEHRSAFVLGVGFDPRCLVGLKAFLNAATETNPLIIRVELPTPNASAQPLTTQLAAKHEQDFFALTEAVEVLSIPYPAVTNASSAGPTIARNLTEPATLSGVGHLVVDVSSLPTSLYFPILKAALSVADRTHDDADTFAGDLQVVACENPEMDRAIVPLGISSASYVGGFRPLEHDPAEGGGTTVWAPVVGENSEAALRAVHAMLEPDDVCPVLPFPAVDPRRADSLVLEHQVALFDAFQVRSSDLLYADEQNPFDLYRALCLLERDYKRALVPLQPTMIAVSSHSSKLLSLGVLLAAYERAMPILAADGQDYEIMEDFDLASVSAANRLCCLWLTGAPYA